MKRLLLFAAAASLCALAGCANLKTAWSTITSATVSPKAVVVAANAFDAAEKTATNYISYCAPNPAPAGCDDKAIQSQLIPAIRSGRTARNSLEAFQKAHPGELGDQGVYDALVSATSTISAIVANYKG